MLYAFWPLWLIDIKWIHTDWNPAHYQKNK